MSTSDAKNLPLYRFDEFELDCAHRELRRRGEAVPIQPKAFELLRYLIEHRDRAVDKDELQDALWPRSIVTEASLTRSVMKARRAVDDDSDRQAVIRTVHGHGYRFVATVAEGPAAATAPESPPESPAAESTAAAPASSGRERRWLPLAMTLAVVGLLAAWWGLSRDAGAGAVRLAVLPIANATGDAELDWVTTGLMSLLNRLLENHGLEVVDERPVLALLERHPPSADAAGEDFVAALRQTENATHTLAATLTAEDGVYRLQYTLHGARGRPSERTAIASEPTGMVPAVADTVARLLAGSRYEDARRRIVSDDAFVNEAYARALSLQFAGRLEEALRLFRVVIEQEPELFWPRYEYALTARNLREWDIAIPLLEQLVAEAGEEGATAEQAAAMNSLGIARYSRDEFDEALRLFEDTLRLAESTGDLDRMATAHVNLALVAKATGDVGLARAHLDRAIELTYAQGVASLPGTLTNNMSGVLIRQGRFEEAERYSRDAIANFRLTGNRLYEASALSRLSTVLRHQGRLDDAEETQELALAIRTELGNDVGRMSSFINLAALASERGDLTRAHRLAEQGRDIAVAIADRLGTASALSAMADAERRLGHAGTAAADFSSAADIFADIGDRAGEYAARRGLARSLLAAGDLAGATAVAEDLLAAAVERERRYDEARALAVLADIRSGQDRPEDAIRLLERSLTIAAELDDPRLEAEAVEGLARCYLALGQADAAEPHIVRLSELEPAGAAAARLRAELAYGRGDLDGAVEALRVARESAGEGWTAADAQRLDDYRAELAGLRVAPR